MKKIIIICFACMYTVLAFGQLSVQSNGYINANNLKIDGCIGEPGYEIGGALRI